MVEICQQLNPKFQLKIEPESRSMAGLFQKKEKKTIPDYIFQRNILRKNILFIVELHKILQVKFFFFI